jgi:hypothetical protein
MNQSKYPDGWDEERVRRVLERYEVQSDEEAVAEDATTHTMMEVPVELVPVVRELIAKRSPDSGETRRLRLWDSCRRRACSTFPLTALPESPRRTSMATS